MISSYKWKNSSNFPTLQIAMGEGIVAEAPYVIMSEGIGSCLVIILYDAKRKIGGMAHIMKPYFDDNTTVPVDPLYRYVYANTAIDTLLNEMLNKGAAIIDISAKIIGGAKMFSIYNGNGSSLGENNIVTTKHILEEKKIPLKGWDIHGHHGRSVEFHLESGRVVIRAIEKENKEI